MALLAPYRVIDLTDERGHLAGLILAQLGADVIAIEPPGGSRARRIGPFEGDEPGPERSFAHWSFNRGKRSVVLDIAGSDDDRRAFEGLVAGADILIDNAEPGLLESWGLGGEHLAALNPALVHVSITPFGQNGPKAGYAANDLVLMAAGGYLSLTGDDDRPPVRISLPQAWHHAAADAAGAAMIALWERQRSGQGQRVDVSAQSSLLQATQSMVLAAPYGAPIVVRIAGGVKLPPLDIRLIWPCKDGHVTIAFLFGTSIGPFTARLMEWVHAEGFCDDATLAKDWIGFAVKIDEGTETVEEFERVKACVAAFLVTKTKDELLEAALTRRLLIAPITTIADVAESPQLASRDYWQNLAVPGATTAGALPGHDRPLLGDTAGAARATPDRGPAHRGGPGGSAPLPRRPRRHQPGGPRRAAAGRPQGARLHVGDGGPGLHPGPGRLRGDGRAGRVASTSWR